MAATKWFNLAGAKEAYIQDVKLRWVDDANLNIPWLNFYLRSASNWDFFTLAFPDQAWILKQIQLIDRDIDEGLAALKELIPSNCRPWFWVRGSIDDGTRCRHPAPVTVFTYYQSPAAVFHQQAVMLYYARYLESESYDERVFDGYEQASERLRMQTFRAACVELVEGPCLKDRARLVEELLSPESTAALLSAQPSTDMPIWNVRREVARTGLVITKAMRQMRDALGLEEEENREGDVKTQVLPNLDGKKVSLQGGKCDPESDDRCPTPRNIAQGMDTDERRCDIPARGCSSCGTILESNANETEGEWASVVEEDESHGF